MYLNGALGDYLTFNKYKCRAVLIDFDHNKDLETNGENSITLQFGQNEDGINIAFVDSKYNTYGDNYNCLCMNLTQTSSGGWKSSHMRNTICPQFLELLPTDLQNVIGTVTKYTDNVGNGTGHVESNVTATQDKVFLLNVYECNTTSNYFNSYESNYTEPYYIYNNASSRVKYRHSDDSYLSTYWLRSPVSVYEYRFCDIFSTGDHSYFSAYGSYGICPAIVIY